MKTTKMKKILIALDYDSSAKKVAETGYSFARAMNGEVILLHVVSDKVYYYSRKEYAPIMGVASDMDTNKMHLESLDGLKKVAQQFLDKSKKQLGDDSIVTIVLEGNFSNSILSVAKEHHVDVIVMGSHSRNSLETIILGSVTEKVLHYTGIPLLIIPTKKPD